MPVSRQITPASTGTHEKKSFERERSAGTVRCRGSTAFRLRVCLSLLTGRPLYLDGIRASDTVIEPGLRDYEVSLLQLVEKLSNGTVVEINETGTRLRMLPGVLIGGRVVHECGASRSIGWFMESVLLLAVFARRPTWITLKGTTNDGMDPGVDVFRQTTLPLLRSLGVGNASAVAGVTLVGSDPSTQANSVYDESFDLRMIKRGVGKADGEVELKVPVATQLPVLRLLDEGLVKRVRGVAYSINVTPQFSNRMVDGCRGVLNNLLPDVFIFTDHSNTARGAGINATGRGYGIVLNAETTSGCNISAGHDSHYRSGGKRGDGDNEDDEHDERDVNDARDSSDMPSASASPSSDIELPEDVGRRAARVLLEEVRRGGAVDSTHQALMVVFAACGPAELHRFRLGPLSPSCIRALREVRRFLGTTFLLQPEKHTNTVIASCIGSGITKTSKRSL